MNDVSMVLRMCLGAEAAALEGPGWYIYAQGGGELFPPVRIAPQAAEIIAGAFEHVVQATGAQVAATPMQIVGSGNQMVRRKLQRDLEEAEAAASKIKGLRQSLQALETSGTVESASRETGEPRA